MVSYGELKTPTPYSEAIKAQIRAITDKGWDPLRLGAFFIGDALGEPLLWAVPFDQKRYPLDVKKFALVTNVPSRLPFQNKHRSLVAEREILPYNTGYGSALVERVLVRDDQAGQQTLISVATLDLHGWASVDRVDSESIQAECYRVVFQTPDMVHRKANGEAESHIGIRQIYFPDINAALSSHRVITPIKRVSFNRTGVSVSFKARNE